MAQNDKLRRLLTALELLSPMEQAPHKISEFLGTAEDLFSSRTLKNYLSPNQKPNAARDLLIQLLELSCTQKMQPKPELHNLVSMLIELIGMMIIEMYNALEIGRRLITQNTDNTLIRRRFHTMERISGYMMAYHFALRCLQLPDSISTDAMINVFGLSAKTPDALVLHACESPLRQIFPLQWIKLSLSTIGDSATHQIVQCLLRVDIPLFPFPEHIDPQGYTTAQTLSTILDTLHPSQDYCSIEQQQKETYAKLISVSETIANHDGLYPITKEQAYTALRLLPLKYPVLEGDEYGDTFRQRLAELFNVLFGITFMASTQITAQLTELFELMYAPVPPQHIIQTAEGEQIIWVCSLSQAPMAKHHDHWVSPFRGNLNNGYKSFPVISPEHVFAATETVQYYIIFPGIDELSVYEYALEKGLEADLYPNCDKADVIIKKSGREHVIDLKDYQNPSLLGRTFTGFKACFSGEPYDRYLVVPDYLVRKNPAYLQDLKAACHQDTEPSDLGYNVLSVSQLKIFLDA